MWTIGVGHTAGAGSPDPRTMPKGVEVPVAELIELFRRDLAKFEADVAKSVKVLLAEHEFDALVSMHFNKGAIARASFVEALNCGDRASAAKRIMNLRKPPEIIPRRTAEMMLFRDERYSADGRCSIYPANARGQVQWKKGKRVDMALLPKGPPVKQQATLKPDAKAKPVPVVVVGDEPAAPGDTVVVAPEPEAW